MSRNGKKSGSVNGHRDEKGREDETIDYVFNALDIPVCYYLIAVGIGVIVGLRKRGWDMRDSGCIPVLHSYGDRAGENCILKRSSVPDKNKVFTCSGF